MPLGQVKRLVEEFRPHPDSVFALVSPMRVDDDTDVWVTMGAEEEHHVATLNFVSETQGKRALKITE
ncbi:unnamed protein product, partial [Nesidiocoris tenuis]